MDYLMFWCTEGNDSLRDRDFLVIRNCGSDGEARERADAAEGVEGCWEVFTKGENLEFPVIGKPGDYTVQSLSEEEDHAQREV